MPNLARRKAMKTFTVGMCATPALACFPGTVQANTDAKFLTIGAGGSFSDLDDALAAVSANASSNSPYLLVLLPGVHDLRGRVSPVILPEGVSLTGQQRRSVIVLLSDDVSIQLQSNTSITDLTLEYQGDGAAIISAGQLFDVELSRMTIRAEGSGAAIRFRNWTENAELRDVQIVTEGVGIDIERGGLIQAYNTRIVMIGENSGTFHWGYSIQGSTRLWHFGGMIGSGYGYPEINDPNQDVIGVYCRSEMRGRVELRDVWSICRNDAAGVGNSVVNCVRIEAQTDAVRVRAFGCYLQAESSDGQGLVNAVYTTEAGRFETYGSRVRDSGGTPTYGGLQTGVSRYSTVDDGARLETGTSGFILLDATEGPFRLRLDGGWVVEGEQYIFKKVDGTDNDITIEAGNGWTIEGSAEKQLALQNQTLHLRSAGNTWWVT